MTRPTIFLLAFVCSLLLLLDAAPHSAQQPTTQQKPPEQESVVRISTQLVQIDVVVTDKKGVHADDLREEDFELLVDNKRQPLSHFSLVKLPVAEKDKTAPENKAAATPSTAPTKAIAPEQVKRTIAFVVDDLGLSFESTYSARRALKKFLAEQMQEGDLVGIIRTGRGLGALQQFTSDKRLLNLAVDKLSWNPVSRDMMPRFGAPDPNQSEEARQAEARFEDFRETVFSVGTLGALNFVVRGLRELPGRKTVVLISDGFRLFGRERDNDLALQRVRRLVDLANRSSVVVYSLDAKGLQTLLPDASVSGAPPIEQYAQAAQANFDAQEGLAFLARETGGLSFFNNNDLNFGIQQALRDQQSYYLLGFDPDDAQFDRKFHTLKIKIKRPGLQARTRAGFLGQPDNAPRPAPKTRDEQVLAALYSPFGARDLPLQMTSFFFNAQQSGSFVRSLFHIDCNQLTFKETGDGNRELKLEIIAFTFNEAGAVIEQIGRAFTLPLDEKHYQAALARGLAYTVDFLIKQPGAYQFRAVLRDPETGRLGSAGQFLQVPDLTKNRLAVSGLIVAAARTDPPPNAENQPATPTPPRAEQSDVHPTPAVRRFPQTGQIDYGAVIYNATTNKQTGQPQVTTQLEIYRDGKVVFQAQPRELTPGAGADPKRLDYAGRLKLAGFPPGDYLLHVIVTDKLASTKYARAEQWIDFGVR